MKVDVIISGGGLVGTTLAGCLKNQHLTVALIDKIPPMFSPQKEARALALSPASIQCLQMIGVWPKITFVGAISSVSEILKIHISKQHYFGVTEICAADFQLPALGAVVHADYLNHVLYETVQALPHVKVFCPDEIVDLDRSDRHWEVRLKSGKSLTTALLAAADGAASFVRQHEGIQVSVQDHAQTAIVVNVTLAQSHYGTAFERFTEDGSIAFLPFGDRCVKCVWIVPSARAAALESLSDTEFMENIQRIFGFRVGRFVSLGTRMMYPLRTVRSHSIYTHRLALIGNAANSLHPIAAQGFNLGLRDAASLAEHVSIAHREQKDIGAINVLRAYANGREADHDAILQFTHCVSERRALQWLGILAAEYCLPFKRKVVEWGVGKTARLPKLCRGIAL